MAMRSRNHDKVAAALAANRPFNVGNAMTAIEGCGSTGRLSGNHLNQYHNDRLAGIAYTVYSYATPIAWVTKAGLTRIPNVGYSVTTTNHQSLCRVYLAGERAE